MIAPLPCLHLRSTATASTPSQNLTMLRRSLTTNQYSISDQDLDTRGFNLHRTIAELNLDHLNKVFVAVGFPKQDPDKIQMALLWMEYRKTKWLVAFVRAMGDSVFNRSLASYEVS
ncbi:serotonin N-acetyltransferase 2, chloroplastic-like [Pyrus x bretschneideri]|uniref:serotonin N-acetyltransferase 2, chloroplastic-like n=1 Tax=Pyrus x bretschneideri TaxID=225117 RepID=UPI00202EDBB2|nr:serotonin N-acetyltransferase 2, chloroplastic-like [Pyrus x bretschneideri]